MTDNTTYTVFHSSDSSRAYRGLSVEDAAQELLFADGHDYEIRQDGTWHDGTPVLRLFVTQFSRNSPLGGSPMVSAVIMGQTEKEIFQQVLGRDWHGMEAVTDEQFDAMVAAYEAELAAEAANEQ